MTKIPTKNERQEWRVRDSIDYDTRDQLWACLDALDTLEAERDEARELVRAASFAKPRSLEQCSYAVARWSKP